MSSKHQCAAYCQVRYQGLYKTVTNGFEQPRPTASGGLLYAELFLARPNVAQES